MHGESSCRQALSLTQFSGYSRGTSVAMIWGKYRISAVAQAFPVKSAD